MVIIKLLTTFKYSIVYIKYTSRRNDIMNMNVVDLNSINTNNNTNIKQKRLVISRHFLSVKYV